MRLRRVYGLLVLVILPGAVPGENRILKEVGPEWRERHRLSDEIRESENEFALADVALLEAAAKAAIAETHFDSVRGGFRRRPLSNEDLGKALLDKIRASEAWIDARERVEAAEQRLATLRQRLRR